PVGSSIPREFSDRVEVKYQKEYLLTIRSLAPENIPVMVNGEAINLIGSIEKWMPEGSKVDVRVLVDETERGWIREPKQLSLIMNSPVSIVVEYEEKPYSWALDSPLKPLLYPILETVARSYKGTGMWPQVSQIISQPTTVYAIVFSIPAGFAGIGYLCYRVISRIGVGGLKIGRARKIIEERIRRASPEEIMSAIPSSTTPTPVLSREEIKLPEHFELPDWLRISKVEVEMGRYKPVSIEKTERVEVKEAVEELGEVEELEEEVRSTDVLELISRGGEVRADELMEALMNRLDEEVLEKLRSAVLSGELKVTALRDTVWSPVKVRKIFKALDMDGMIALEGSDHYTRKRVAEWAGVIEHEVTGKPYIWMENAYEKDTDSIAARIGGSSLVILGEGVGLDVARAYASTAKLLDVKLIKLGVGPLRTIMIEDPSMDELAAYMVAKATLMGLIDRIGLGEVWEVSRIASMSRSYDTIDDYLKELSSGPMEIESFRKMESEKLFDEYEREAVAVWQETKNVGDALAHYSNILAQIDPANMNLKLDLFKEKLNKMAKGVEEARGVRVKPRVEARETVKTDVSELKAKLAEKYTPILKNIKDEEVRRKLLRYLGMEGRHEKKS
ncbi:MAG: hypothetical protein LZ174_06945, partial [Thaumarchaeota archaeon]|nr:hypothetical protein [Candidatus Geocrenenecus arthurdayi]